MGNRFLKLGDKTMRFIKAKNVYKIIRITGSQDNILGISFDDKNKSDGDIEIIHWDFPNIDRRKSPTSDKEVLKQMLSGLKYVNQNLETDYRLSKIYFSPWDSPACQVYTGLIAVLIRHYHNGNKFEEV